MGQLKTPIAFIIFNRLDTTIEVFTEIRKVQPERLYLISDGARNDKEGEVKRVDEVRKYVETHVDWPCCIRKNYASGNMGCRDRVASGINWVLEQEEMVIILEDDCKPTEDFFPYAEELLLRYKEDERVMMVSGTNLVKGCQIQDSYTFSWFPSIWGWATWRRAWRKYDIDIKDWPDLKKNGYFKKYYKPLTYYLMRRDFGKVYRHEKDTWDHQWDYARVSNGGLGIVPCVNMIENLGFGREDATHTTDRCVYEFSCSEMPFPIQHPPMVKPDIRYDTMYQKSFFGFRRIQDCLMKKIRRALR